LSGAAIKLAIVSLFVFLTGGPSVIAQYDESNPAVYWRMERARQQQFNARQAKKARRIIQRPTRLIRRARPKRGYTRAVPAAPKPAGPVQAGAAPVEAAPGAVPQIAPGAQQAGAPLASGQVPGQAPAAQQPTPKQPPAVQNAGPQTPIVRIAVLGDNLGSQLARGLAAAYEGTPQIEILRQTKDNSGLVRKDYYDWDKTIRELLSSGVKIDIAVMMIGSNDGQSIRDDDGVHAPRSPEWNTRYTGRIEAIARIFKDKNIPLIWVGMPVMRIERLSANMIAFNQMYREAIRKHGGIFVDVWEAFLDDRSRFTLYGPDVNGEIVKLRVGDGVHFTNAGARKLAHFAEIDLKRIIDKRRPSAPASAIAAVPGAGTGNQQSVPKSTVALPRPDAPAKIVIPVRPATGPVIELTALPLAPGGELAQMRKTPSSRGLALAGAIRDAQPGRGDDFRWPRR
jgi:hypothetical protein